MDVERRRKSAMAKTIILVFIDNPPWNYRYICIFIVFKSVTGICGYLMVNLSGIIGQS
jgi:hypothetical protein